MLKSKLRRIKLSIKKLAYYHEIGINNELHVLYGYMPMTFKYDREKAQALTE